MGNVDKTPAAPAHLPRELGVADTAAHQYRGWWLGFLALGIAWRGLRYALCFPFWGDETYLNINILHRGYADLLEPLEYSQIAPLFYLWIQRFQYNVFGGGEYALRAFSFVAGVTALLAFALLARYQLAPRAAAIATGIFGASYYLVRHTCESKPYAGDLAVSTLLLFAAVHWLREPRRLTAPLLGAFIGAAGVWLSYPAIFVAAGIGLAVLSAVFRTRSVKAWIPWIIYVVAVAGSFLAFYALFVAEHSATVRGSWLEDYWRGSFPPTDDLLALSGWLLTVHTGRLAAHPLGGAGFGSVLTTLACVVGAVSLFRARRGRVVLLVLLTPFIMALGAAALRLYPYGGSVRVSMHLAPAVCLLAGAGAAVLIDRIGKHSVSEIVGGVIGVILIILPIGGMIKDCVAPYKSKEYRAARRAMREVCGKFDPDDRIVVVNPKYGTYGPPDGPKFDSTLRYYLVLYTGREPLWHGASTALAGADWALAYQGPDFGPTPERVRELLAAAGLALESHYQTYRFSDTTGAGMSLFGVTDANSH